MRFFFLEEVTWDLHVENKAVTGWFPGGVLKLGTFELCLSKFPHRREAAWPGCSKASESHHLPWPLGPCKTDWHLENPEVSLKCAKYINMIWRWFEGNMFSLSHQIFWTCSWDSCLQNSKAFSDLYPYGSVRAINENTLFTFHCSNLSCSLALLSPDTETILDFWSLFSSL